MDFNEVLAQVLEITKRPDKTERTKLAINKAISYCTIMCNFPQDTVEATFAIDPALYGDTVELTSLERFRKFEYVKPTGAKFYLSYLKGDKIFTPGGSAQLNKYYLAGTSMVYTLAALTPTLEISYLTYPPILDQVTLPDYWMLDEMPFPIIDFAAAEIFKQIGDDTSAARHRNEGMEFYKTVRRDKALMS